MIQYMIVVFAWILIGSGLLGVIVPGLPGLPFILAGISLYAYQTGFHAITSEFIVAMAALTVIGTAADYLSSLFGAKRFGASRIGMWGAFIGGIIGLFLLPIWGIIAGPLAGAILGEMVAGNKSGKAASIGLGTFFGILTGTLLKFAIAVSMVSLFIRQLIL